MDDYENCETVILKNRVFFKRAQYKKQLIRKFISEQELLNGTIISFPHSNEYKTSYSKTNIIPTNRPFKRAGVIPFATIDNTKYYCLGIDSKYGNLTDFGGTAAPGENFLMTACRELREESLAIFNISPLDMFKYSTAVYDHKNIIIFIELHLNKINTIVEEFHKRLSKVNSSENCSILWVPEHIFINLIKYDKSYRDNDCIYPSMYKTTSNILKSASYFENLL